MENNRSESFTAMFNKLTPKHQRYIIALQQDLISIQMQEGDEKHIYLNRPAKPAGNQNKGGHKNAE